MSSSDSIQRNVESWTRTNAEYTDEAAAAAWAQEEITWGMFRVSEAELGVLGEVAALDVVELGCGTAYFSAWLARRGARPVGVDPTPAQLDTARRLQAQTGIEFPLVEAPGESVPLEDGSFDLVLSEHGAATWADPYEWIPEAARLLRADGRLVFMHTTPLATVCFADDDSGITTSLQRPYFGLHRLEWPDADGVEFQLAHGDWIDVLRRAGLDVERLIEVQAPPHAGTHEYYSHVPAGWARQWPNEEIWVARKRG
jgi:SAM-dependent methyltransferase